MALEPITRQEQIIAGKDLEPITRMERFLKEYGGGVGGAVGDEQIKNAVENYLDENPIGVDLSVTGATVGQTVKISAVDENGVPTAWEAADFPSGGLEYIGSVTVESGVSEVVFDLGGNYDRIMIADASWATAALTSGEFAVWLNNATANPYKVGSSSGAANAWKYSVMTIEAVKNSSGTSFVNFIYNSGGGSGDITNVRGGTNIPDATRLLSPIWSVKFTVNKSDATFNAKTYDFWGVKA
jgi:hypothetical protein